ncbi:hypothetical protein CH063_09606, partial [Colletotrichum higginsianum]
ENFFIPTTTVVGIAAFTSRDLHRWKKHRFWEPGALREARKNIDVPQPPTNTLADSINHITKEQNSPPIDRPTRKRRRRRRRRAQRQRLTD